MVNIQLFSDGGIYNKYKLAISSGLMFVDKKKVLSFCKKSTNSNSDFAELFAINKLLSRAYGYCKQKDILNEDFVINVYTDSLSSIIGVSGENTNPNNVKRIQLLNEIKDTIEKFDNKVVFYHIKSHVSGTNLKTSYHMFCKKNEIDISFNEFLFLYQQNKKCDNMIAKEFKKFNKQLAIEKSTLEKLKKKEERELNMLLLQEVLLDGPFKELEI